MPGLTISQVARKVGLMPSAIRYYEQIGILLPAHRIHGHRRYDTGVFDRLAVIQRAQQIGFTLAEIKKLFFGFGSATRPSQRWRKLSQQKLLELDQLNEGIKSVQDVLKKMMRNCRCETLEECGRKIGRSGRTLPKFVAPNRRNLK